MSEIAESEIWLRGNYCTEKNWPSAAQEEDLTKNGIHWDLDLGIPSLQNYEKYMSVI